MKKSTQKQLCEKFAQIEKLDQLVLDANTIRRDRRAKLEQEIQEILKAQEGFPKRGEHVWIWYTASVPQGECREGKITEIAWRPELEAFKICVCVSSRFAWRTVDKIYRSEDECMLGHLKEVLEQTKCKEKELAKQIARLQHKIESNTKPS